MKRYFLLILLLWFSALFPILSSGQSLLEEEEPPENYQLQVFLEEEDAIAKIFTGCDKVESEILALTPEGLEYFKGLLKRPDIETTFEVYMGKRGNVIDRYAIIAEEMGCFHPITWILSTNTEGKILDIAVMIYRESRGQEVSRRRFLKQFEGKSLKDPFSTNKDKIVAITFWATWCKVCQEHLPELNTLYGKYKDKNVEIIGVSLDDKGKEVKDFMEKKGIAFPILRAKDKEEMSYVYNVKKIPLIYYYKNGELEHIEEGYTDSKHIEEDLRSCLEGSKPPSKDTRIPSK